jgi:endonuclease III
VNHAQVTHWRRRTTRVTEKLTAVYGRPRHGNFRDPTHEIFYALLSKKTAPERYRPTFRKIQRRFNPWTELVDIDLQELALLLAPLGMSAIRARQMVGIAKRINADFGRVSLKPLRKWSEPEVHQYLLGLPGIGEKIARCVMMYSLGMDVSPMDTHATRVLTRLGLLPAGASSREVHRIMDERMPRGLSFPLHVTLIAHGRAVCKARAPLCGTCVLRRLCPFLSDKSRVVSGSTSTRVAAYRKSATVA